VIIVPAIPVTKVIGKISKIRTYVSGSIGHILTSCPCRRRATGQPRAEAPVRMKKGRGYHEESAQYPERGQVIPEVAAPSQPGVERKHDYYARQQDPEKYPR
jgi:hypothetical protein